MPQDIQPIHGVYFSGLTLDWDPVGEYQPQLIIPIFPCSATRPYKSHSILRVMPLFVVDDARGRKEAPSGAWAAS